eukprot:616675-Pleurochrysis_carterae.AAC.1
MVIDTNVSTRAGRHVRERTHAETLAQFRQDSLRSSVSVPALSRTDAPDATFRLRPSAGPSTQRRLRARKRAAVRHKCSITSRL